MGLNLSGGILFQSFQEMGLLGELSPVVFQDFEGTNQFFINENSMILF